LKKYLELEINMNSKKISIVSFMILSTLAAPFAHSVYADGASPQPGLISANEVSAIAKNSVVQEVADLNNALANINGASDHSIYKAKLLKSFVQQTHKNQIDPGELYERCTYSESDLVNLSSPVLRTEDDATAGQMKALQTVDSLYGKDVWRLFSQACHSAQKRFEQRLVGASSNGTALNLDAAVIKNMSSVIFFPTLVGSAPSEKREAMTTLFNTVILGSLVFGPISALNAIAVGNDFIMIATASNMGYGLVGELTSMFQKTPNAKLGELLSRSPTNVSLDLNPSEQAEMKSAN
jgi:hypothetical protein